MADQEDLEAAAKKRINDLTRKIIASEINIGVKEENIGKRAHIFQNLQDHIENEKEWFVPEEENKNEP